MILNIFLFVGVRLTVSLRASVPNCPSVISVQWFMVNLLYIYFLLFTWLLPFRLLSSCLLDSTAVSTNTSAILKAVTCHTLLLSRYCHSLMNQTHTHVILSCLAFYGTLLHFFFLSHIPKTNLKFLYLI